MLYTNDAITKRKLRADKIRSKFTILVYIIIIPLVIYNLVLIAQSIINPGVTPSFLGIKTYVIISGSMEPGLNIGDIAVVREVDESEINVGDVISFRQGQNVITHRITEKIETNGSTEYITKGDNNNAEDHGTITYENIEGKQITVIPYLGNVVLMLQKGIFVVVLLIGIYVYMLFSGNSKRKRTERNVKRVEYEEKVRV